MSDVTGLDPKSSDHIPQDRSSLPSGGPGSSYTSDSSSSDSLSRY